MRKLLISLALCGSLTTMAQQRKKLNFPDLPGYITLTADLHIHTVFSDGGVWPTIRVEEAIREGLDVVSMTDHLEYQPHKKDLPHPDRNRGYQLAAAYAKQHDILVVNGSEVTRSMPPGHFNAIYVADVNKLMEDDPMKVFEEAGRQGGFIFWNHPIWPAKEEDGSLKVFDMHKELLEKGLIHGIEVINGPSYYKDAVAFALEHDLAMLGASDVHGLTEWDYNISSGGYRPATIIFAKERTVGAVREALMAGRTIAWSGNTLVGKEDHLRPFIEQCLTANNASYEGVLRNGTATVLSVPIVNNSEVSFNLEYTGDYELHEHFNLVEIPANKTTVIKVKTREKVGPFMLQFRALNAITAPDKNAEFEIKVAVD